MMRRRTEYKSSEEDRYRKLGLTDSIGTIYLYSLACKELASFLRLSLFYKLPKHLQHLILNDVVFAFQTLPQMQGSSAVEAANLLLQAAEVALPKQKRSMAVKEFKHAMVAHKRRWKTSLQIEGISQIPHDVLVHIFSFLDLQSLLAAASVSRSWNVAASDNRLWQLQYYIFSLRANSCLDPLVCRTGPAQINNVCIDSREAFKRDFKGTFLKKYNASARGYCMLCSAIVWLIDLKGPCKYCEPSCKIHLVKPVSNQKIVKYVMDGSFHGISYSDSDSDSEEESPRRLWTYQYPTLTT